MKAEKKRQVKKNRQRIQENNSWMQQNYYHVFICLLPASEIISSDPPPVFLFLYHIQSWIRGFAGQGVSRYYSVWPRDPQSKIQKFQLNTRLPPDSSLNPSSLKTHRREIKTQKSRAV